MTKQKRKRRKTPAPLAPPPGAMRSRRVARITTTLFHKHTRDRDLALKQGDAEAAKAAEQAIEVMGGRDAYQRASQLNTSLHSTSRWALGVLGEKGWLQGVSVEDAENDAEQGFQSPPAAAATSGGKKQTESNENRRKKRKLLRRNVRLLEVGAINRELLDAAARTRGIPAGKKVADEGDANTGNTFEEEKVYHLDVRAIDLRSSQPGIEEANFLQLPLVHSDPAQRYDAIVCSMVINCVTTPEDRGRMLCLLYHQLRPGGLCFLTLPRLCLMQSRHTTPDLFRTMLTAKGGGVGFEIERTKESPKVAFFVLRRPLNDGELGRQLDRRWTEVRVINRAKKFRNTFCCVLDEDEVFGRAFT